MKNGDVRWLRRKAIMDSDLARSPLDSSGVTLPSMSGGPSPTARPFSAHDLSKRLHASAFAFRGYDVANLGRSRELLDHPVYGPVVAGVLAEASAICSESVGSRVDLAAYIRAGEKTALEHFAHDVATIVGMEMAQLELLKTVFNVPIGDVRLSFGYSIGELSALIFSGVFSVAELLPIPLDLAPDCSKLAHDTTLGVLFTRGPELPIEEVERLCEEISGEGRGLIGPSAFLSPNTALLLAQGKTLDRVEALMRDALPVKVMLRRNPNQWPPLHSPLVLQELVPDRAARALYQIQGNPRPPRPPVVSMVTGKASYDGVNTRRILTDWTDHPQRLWDVIDTTLSEGVETIIHVGPGPSLIAATFARISNNVSRHMGHGNKYLHMLGRGIVSGLNRNAWLGRLLPSKTALLRVPYLAHVSLEDWLLEQPVVRPIAVAPGAIEGNGVAHRAGEVADSARVAASESV